MSDETKNKKNIFTEDLDRVGFALYRTQGKISQIPSARYSLFCYIISLIYVQNTKDTSASIVRYRHLKNQDYEFGLIFDNEYSYLTVNSLSQDCSTCEINNPLINRGDIVNKSIYNASIDSWERRFIEGLDIKQEELFLINKKPNWDIIYEKIRLYVEQFNFDSEIMQMKQMEMHFFTGFVSHNKYSKENFKFEIINYILFAFFFCSDKSLYYLYKNENFFDSLDYDQEFKKAITQIKIVADDILNNRFGEVSNKTFEDLNSIFSIQTENDIANRFLTCVSKHLKACLSKQEKENNGNSSYETIAKHGRYIVIKMSNPIDFID